MNSLFENLVLYEVILLLLGIFLFLILSGGLVYYIVKKEEIKKLLAFFIVPIIMIAYPSIQEIQFGESKLVMYDKMKEVLNDPNDSTALAELKEVTVQIENRVKTVRDITALSNSFRMLGDQDKALYYADKALQLNEKKNKTNTSKFEKISKNKNTNKKHDSLKKDPKNTKGKILNYKNNVTKLENIKTMAKIEKAIKTDPTLLKDSVRLSKHLTQIKKLNNTVQYKYFTKKYLNKTTVNKTTKN